MRTKGISVFLAFMLTFGMLITAQAKEVSKTITENEIGTHDGYDYELWKDSGDTAMTLGEAGAFSCSWSNISNALFRKGLKFDETQTYGGLGNISITYECDYNPDGNSYLCVYGWTVDPLVEYYIVDSWGSWRPPGAIPKGTITVDGGDYHVYETTRVEQPSIKGTATFQQYWSVRTEKRTSGTISVSEHFQAWESLGMPMGKMYEAALLIEGYRSSGTADILSNVLTMGGDIPQTAVVEAFGGAKTAEPAAEASEASEAAPETALEAAPEVTAAAAAPDTAAKKGSVAQTALATALLALGASAIAFVITRRKRR